MTLSFISLFSIHPGFLPQTHQVLFFTRTLTFAPVYLKCASFRPWQEFLSNIQVIFSARLRHLEHGPPSYPSSHSPSQYLLCFQTHLLWNCLVSLSVASGPPLLLYASKTLPMLVTQLLGYLADNSFYMNICWIWIDSISEWLMNHVRWSVMVRWKSSEFESLYATSPKSHIYLSPYPPPPEVTICSAWTTQESWGEKRRQLSSWETWASSKSLAL